MNKFESREKVAVRVDGDPNTIWIRAGCSDGMRSRIRAAVARVRGTVGEDQQTYEFDVDAANRAVLAEFVLGWEGPDFDGMECTIENLLDVNADDPLMLKLHEEIDERSASKAVTSPNSRTNGHAPSTRAKAALGAK